MYLVCGHLIYQGGLTSQDLVVTSQDVHAHVGTRIEYLDASTMSSNLLHMYLVDNTMGRQAILILCLSDYLHTCRVY